MGFDSEFWASRGDISLPHHAHFTANALSKKRALQLESVSMVKSWPWSQPHTAWMMPQYSEDSALWRLGRDPQLTACSCTQPTKPCRHRGLEVIRSAEENQQKCQSHGATLGPTWNVHPGTYSTHPYMFPPLPLRGAEHQPCKASVWPQFRNLSKSQTSLVVFPRAPLLAALFPLF